MKAKSLPFYNSGGLVGMCGVAMAFFLACPNAAEARVNLIENGGFEADSVGSTSFTGYTITNIPPDYPASVISYNSNAVYPDGAQGESVPQDSGSISPDASRTNNQALYFVSDKSKETISQSTYLIAGVYSIGFSGYATSNGFDQPDEAFFQGSVAGQLLANYAVSTLPKTQWLHFSGTTTITTAGWYTTSFSFNANGPFSKDIIVDNVFLVAGGVPELATWAMMLVGFAGLGLLACRRANAKPSLALRS